MTGSQTSQQKGADVSSAFSILSQEFRNKNPKIPTYTLLDSGEFQKLEQIGPFKIQRPSLSAPWNKLRPELWQDIDATFVRKSDGSGDWKIKNKKLSEVIVAAIGPLLIELKLTNFGHLGIFFEQFDNWCRIYDTITQLKKSSDKPVKILNLFAYTGMSSLVGALAGAEVTHVDASKGTVKWAQTNAQKNAVLESSVIRWITEDVVSFVAREVRRGNKYHGIILDPPTYGRGDKKQVWKIEENLVPLLEELDSILENSKNSFVNLSGHSEGFGPLTLSLLLKQCFKKEMNVSFNEMSIPSETGVALPSGYTSFGKLI